MTQQLGGALSSNGIQGQFGLWARLKKKTGGYFGSGRYGASIHPSIAGQCARLLTRLARVFCEQTCMFNKDTCHIRKCRDMGRLDPANTIPYERILPHTYMYNLLRGKIRHVLHRRRETVDCGEDECQRSFVSVRRVTSRQPGQGVARFSQRLKVSRDRISGVVENGRTLKSSSTSGRLSASSLIT